MQFSDFKKSIQFSQSVHGFMTMISEGISAAKAIKHKKDHKADLIQQEHFKDQTERMQRKFKFPATFREAQIHAKAVKFGYNPPQLELSANGLNCLKVCPCCMHPIRTEQLPLNYPTTSVLKVSDLKSLHFKDFEPFKLQASVSMFFLFIKMAILYLTIIFCIYSVYTLSHSLDSTICDQYKCKDHSLLHLFSYPSSSKSHKIITQNTQDLLCLLTVFVSLGFFFIYRKLQLKIYDQIDSQVYSQDDFTIFVENIPVYDFPPGFDMKNIPKDKVLAFKYELKLKKIFQDQINQWIGKIQKSKEKNSTIKQLESSTINHIMNRNRLSFSQWRTESIKIQSISLCYELADLKKIEQKREELIDKVKKLGQLVQKHLKQYYKQQLVIEEFSNVNINKYKLDKKRREWEKAKKREFKQTSAYRAIKLKIDQLNNRLIVLNSIELSMNYDFAHNRTPIFNLTHFVGKAFVSFQYKHYREYIIRKFQNGPQEFIYPGTDVSLKISRAPHPTDINWENMKISREDRKNRIMTSFLIMFMGLIFSGFILVLLNSGKRQIVNFGKNRKFLNDMLNYILSIIGSTFISYLNLYVSDYSDKLTEYQSHHTMANQYVSMIAKTLLIQFLNTAFIFWLIHFILDSPLTGSEGLIVQIASLKIINSVKTIGQKVLEHKCWKVILNRKFHDDEDISKFTFQIELNKSFQYPIFNFTDRYADYLLELYTIFLYCYLMPIGAFAGIINFTLQYWIDKVILFKFSSMYNYPGVQLSRLVLKFFEASLVMFTFGCFTFSWKLSGKFPTLNMISLLISVLYLVFSVLMSEKTQRLLFGQSQIQQESYSSVYRVLFQQKYWTQNPATSFIHEKNLNNKKQVIDENRTKIQFANPKLDWVKIINFGLKEIKESDNSESEQEEQKKNMEKQDTKTYIKNQPIEHKNLPVPKDKEEKEMELLRRCHDRKRRVDKGKAKQNNKNLFNGVNDWHSINYIPAWQNSNYLKNLNEYVSPTNSRNSINSQLVKKQIDTKKSVQTQKQMISQSIKEPQPSKKLQVSNKQKQQLMKSPLKNFKNAKSQSRYGERSRITKKSSSSNNLSQKNQSHPCIQEEIKKIIGKGLMCSKQFTMDEYYQNEQDQDYHSFEKSLPKMHHFQSLVEIHDPDEEKIQKTKINIV